MISALGEGIAQSLLPCSWAILLPAIAIGLASHRFRVPGAFTAAVVAGAWVAASGWVWVEVWLAGLLLLVGAALWWRGGAGPIPAFLIGLGAAFSWRPCVGPELGQALTEALTSPIGALPGLTA
ncbi:MAG: hypothetical protein KDB69_09075, partial [Acidimicrobiia bacterium]|nr:hypothetical protein [Acidimicrobiia bacterium]